MIIKYITANDLEELVVYNCKRSEEQKNLAQVVKVENKIIIKYSGGGIFSLCNPVELRLFAFKTIERHIDKKEIEDIKEVDKDSTGLYKIILQGNLTYLIVFNDLSAVLVVPPTKAYVFWSNVNELVEHVVKTRLLLLE